MRTTQDQICKRLALLPEGKVQEVLLFVDFLLTRLNLSPQSEKSTSFGDALQQFRFLVDAEGSDLEEVDFFEDVRNRAPAPTEARW